MKPLTRNYEFEIKSKISEIEDLVLDWMEDMDLPDGTELNGDIHAQGGELYDTIMKYFKDTEKAVDDGMYCMECGALLTQKHTIWNFNHECYCPKCAAMKMIPF